MDETAAQELPIWMDYAKLNMSSAIALEQFKLRKTVHAYLITGAEGLGKATFAKVLVCAFFCASEKKPCGVCTDCKRILHDNSPDVITVRPEGTKQIGVEKVREVIETIAQHAFSESHRVVVIEPAEKLTPQAQNCLLKSLEEPVANVIFLLLTNELTALLGTIASRCVHVKLTPWPDEAIRFTLEKHGYDAVSIQNALPIASGNIGQALTLVSEKEPNDEMRAFLQKALSIKNDSDVVSISTSIKEDREGAGRYLNVLEQAIHQALLIRTGQLDATALRDKPPEWAKNVMRAPVESLTELMRAVFEAKRLRASQVNWQSTIDHLMMKILEEQRKWQQSLA